MKFFTKIWLYFHKRKKFKKFDSLGHDGGNFAKASWLCSRGSAFYKAGNFRQAKKDFLKAVKIKNDFIPGYVYLAVLYQRSGDPKTALEILEKTPHIIMIDGKEIAGNDFEILKQITGAYIQLEDWEKVLEFGRKTLEAFNDPVRSHMVRTAVRSGIIEPESDNEIVESLERLIPLIEQKLHGGTDIK